MVQVDPDSPHRCYITITDGKRKLKREHETVHGLTPRQVAEVIRKAFIQEQRRLASEAMTAGARSTG